MRKHSQSQELPFLVELQADQMDIHRIREQQSMVARIQGTISKKDQEIDGLKALLAKYQGYQQKYQSLKVELSQKAQVITRKDGESRLLRRQLEEMVKQAEENAVRTRRWEEEKQQLVRERHSFERASKESERTFKDYQQQCRRREQQLLQDLQQAYHNHREQTTKIDQLEMQVEDTQTLKVRLQQLQTQLQQEQNKQTHQTPAHRPVFNTENDDLSSEVLKLRQELLKRQEDLSRQQVLNFELTMEYDQTVSSLCLLESQVGSYRQQNTQLKQEITQLRQQKQSQKMEIKYLGKNINLRREKEVSQSDTHFEEEETTYCGIGGSNQEEVETRT